MRIKELSPGLVVYVFEPEEGKHFGNRITALQNEDKVMLIDAGYEYQTLQVIKDLKERQLKVEGIIITHFHDDHMEGLKAMPGIPVYGSSYYKDTLDMWTPKEEHKYFTPTVPVEAPMKLSFGMHEVEIIPFPGHSICTSIIKINNEYLHIGDELMFSNQGEPLLPCTTKAGVRMQRESVNKLKDYLGYTFLFGHGEPIQDQKQLVDIIENTKCYFDKILSSTTPISYEEATKDCSCTFLHSGWHENLYR